MKTNLDSWYEILNSIDDQLFGLDKLNDYKLDDELSTIHDKIYTLVGQIKKLVEQQDKEKLEKWTASNK
jgi:hypothetical protein